MAWIAAEWLKLRPYFSLLDFSTKPGSRVAWAVRVAVLSFALVVLWKRLGTYRDHHMRREFDQLPERCLSCKDWMVGAAKRVRSAPVQICNSQGQC